MHMKITRKHSTRGKIYYEIKHLGRYFKSILIWIEYESSENKIARLVKSDSYKSKILKHISNYELKIKVLMMWFIYVFGEPSVCFHIIFSIFSGNFVLKKNNLMIYLAYMKLLPRNVYVKIIRFYYGTMESWLHGLYMNTYIHICI